jgi:hypothetical protein
MIRSALRRLARGSHVSSRLTLSRRLSRITGTASPFEFGADLIPSLRQFGTPGLNAAAISPQSIPSGTASPFEFGAAAPLFSDETSPILQPASEGFSDLGWKSPVSPGLPSSILNTQLAQPFAVPYPTDLSETAGVTASQGATTVPSIPDQIDTSGFAGSGYQGNGGYQRPAKASGGIGSAAIGTAAQLTRLAGGGAPSTFAAGASFPKTAAQWVTAAAQVGARSSSVLSAGGTSQSVPFATSDNPLGPVKAAPASGTNVAGPASGTNSIGSGFKGLATNLRSAFSQSASGIQGNFAAYGRGFSSIFGGGAQGAAQSGGAAASSAASLGSAAPADIGSSAASLGSAAPEDVGASASGGAGALSELSASPAAGTPLAGLATSGGVALALHGLTGNDAGTWGGAAQGAAGGFLIAGPIGAAVGFAIGVGEIAAGVESPRRKAIREVKQDYHITISNSMADQIVQIAKQKYGSNIAIAVRSPDVRQMLGIYAAGTGQSQNSLLSSTIPRAGSLVEQGGQLYQQATYVNGQAYTYQSNLPVLGGPAGTYPSTSGPAVAAVPPPINIQSLSLSVGDKGAADFLSGSVVTSDFVASQYSEAQNNSNGRLQNAATIQQPGLIVG